ncbi:hypothetical protein FE257_000663 [Aspergillus nanangensis]|uniref:adenosine deaminase n=1 Tax=Aspergillus nanangensis TaxID=2582783 RepID=A0AAD4CGG5_ASPNN|nr:hypothetical protein FE257_000663 [Aspergillus nanangensis]
MGATNIQWELDEGIPQVDDPFIQQYLRGRASLILEEQKQRHGGTLVLCACLTTNLSTEANACTPDFTMRKALSPIATHACKIFSKIRDRELRTFWPNGCPPPDAYQPSTLSQVEETDLWRILRRMPKGSLLHAHLDTMVEAEFLFELASTTPGVHIAALKPVAAENDHVAPAIYFQYSPHSKGLNGPTIWDSEYTPQSLIEFHRAASSFPRGGESGFRDWLRDLLSNRKRQYESCEMLDQVRKCHAGSAPIVNSLLSHEPILRACLRRVFSQSNSDGVRYVEVRASFDTEFWRDSCCKPDEECAEWFRIFQEEVEAFKATEEGRSFYGARVIWTITHVSDKRAVVDEMVRCILTKKEYPDVICGLDVVGRDMNKPLVDLVPVLFWFRKQCMEEGVDIPFFFHAGESSSEDGSIQPNTFDAILLGTRRIGQGLTLCKHPLLVDLVKEKKILVECCPLSALDTSATMPLPLSGLLSRGVSVSLCNSPLEIFGHGEKGLTNRFWRALQESNELELTGIAMMAENSVRWSCYEDQPSTEWLSDIREGILGEGLKAFRLREWYAELEKFFEWIALEYAEEDIDD